MGNLRQQRADLAEMRERGLGSVAVVALAWASRPFSYAPSTDSSRRAERRRVKHQAERPKARGRRVERGHTRVGRGCFSPAGSAACPAASPRSMRGRRLPQTCPIPACPAETAGNSAQFVTCLTRRCSAHPEPQFWPATEAPVWPAAGAGAKKGARSTRQPAAARRQRDRPASSTSNWGAAPVAPAQLAQRAPSPSTSTLGI